MNPLLRGAIWGSSALALGGIAMAMTVAPNDSPIVPATHPAADISISYDCPHQIVRYDVTGDGWEKFSVDIPGVPSWNETLYSPGNIQFIWENPGTYWFDHVLVVNGREFHGKRKVVVPEGCNSTTTSSITVPSSTTTEPTTTTNPQGTTTTSTTSTTSTSSSSVPTTESSVPNTTTTTVPSVVTSSPSNRQPSTSFGTLPATK